MSAGEVVSASPPSAPAKETWGGGRWLSVARMAWIAIVALMLALTAWGFVASLRNWELIGSRSIYRVITSAGIPVTLVTVLGLLLPHVVYVATAVLIFVRRSRDWRAMFFALALMHFTSTRPLLAIERAEPRLSFAVDVLLAIGTFSYVTLLLIFPNGRFVPSWTRYIMLAAIPMAAMASRPMRVVMMVPDRPPSAAIPSTAITVMTMSAFLAIGVGAQIYRYRTAADVIERQQIKFVGFAISMLLSILTLGFAVPAIFINTDNAWFAWGMLATVPVILSIPVLVAFAILRYRLFAIDHIISRTLTYTLLTLVLTAVYASAVVPLGPIVGGRSHISVAGATLVVAAIFQPARRRLQELVDRRFNRRKYDLRRTIEQFGSRLHDERNILQLEQELLGIVQDVLQPASVSLWAPRTRRN